jgi:alanine dehydrogenase
MIKIGIIKENKIPTDNRAPLTPKQAKKIKNNEIDLICQTSNIRCFSDKEYKK